MKEEERGGRAGVSYPGCCNTATTASSTSTPNAHAFAPPIGSRRHPLQDGGDLVPSIKDQERGDFLDHKTNKRSSGWEICDRSLKATFLERALTLASTLKMAAAPPSPPG